MSARDEALRAIETRVVAAINQQVHTAGARLGSQMAQAVDEDPPATGHELVSRDAVYQPLTQTLHDSQTRVQDQIQSGHAAAVALAVLLVARALGRDQQQPADLGGFLPAALLDVANAFGATLLDVQDGLRAGYDAITGGPRARRARRIAARNAVNRATTRLGVRVRAAGSVAVHRGFSDAEQALYAEAARSTPGMRITKRWQVTSEHPCAACTALHGTVLPLEAAFDPAAGSSPTKKPLPVYRDLLLPPRHPNCRCRVIYESHSV